jgi:hypothetical protein
MAQQTPDPKLIDSMAMRYRHDFGLLEEPHKEAIRTTMKQLWEEVVGLGFYKDEKFGNSEQLAQQTAVEWLVDQVEDFIGLIPIDIIQQAKEMEKQQKQCALKIIEAQNQYIALLCKEIDSAVSIAYVHGWRSNLVEEGENMRNEINLLSEKFNNFI